MAGKFYAVRVGRTPGIYLSWAECDAATKGFPGAVFKSFKTRAEAEDFMKAEKTTEVNAAVLEDNKYTATESYAFIDGSYNVSTHCYGYGGFLIYDGVKEVLQGRGDDPEMAAMRNVAGEVCGSMAAIRRAVELGIKKLNIYYDYMGIEMWADGSWKRNKKGTIEYHDYVQSVKNIINLNFVKVKGHSGVEGNEEADRLAKQAVGIETEGVTDGNEGYSAQSRKGVTVN